MVTLVGLQNTSSLQHSTEVNIISVKEWMWNVTLAVVMSGMYHVETETGEWVVPWAATAAAPAEAAGVGFLCRGGMLGTAGGRLAPRHRRLAVCRDRACVLIHIRVNTQPLTNTYTHTGNPLHLVTWGWKLTCTWSNGPRLNLSPKAANQNEEWRISLSMWPHPTNHISDVWAQDWWVAKMNCSR